MYQLPTWTKAVINFSSNRNHTLPKFNSEFSPEKWWLEDCFPTGKVYNFSGAMLNFGGGGGGNFH